MTRRRIATMLVALVGLIGPAPWALAQELPATVIQSGEPTDTIKKYVEGCMADMAGPDAVKIRQGRDRMLAPLKNPVVSVKFRQEASRAAERDLRRLADSQVELVSINALRVAGELATLDTGTLVADKLKDSRRSVRLFSAAAIGRIFMAVDQSSPAIGKDDVLVLVERLGEAVKSDPEAPVVHTAIQSLLIGAGVQRAGFESVRPRSITVLSAQVGARAKGLKGEDIKPALLGPMLEAQAAARDALTVNNPKLELSPDAVKAALELNGHLLAAVVRLRKEFAADPEMKDLAEQIIRVAETAAAVGAPKMGGQYTPTQMEADFKAGKDREFFQKALDMFRTLESGPLNLGPFFKP